MYRTWVCGVLLWSVAIAGSERFAGVDLLAGVERHRSVQHDQQWATTTAQRSGVTILSWESRGEPLLKKVGNFPMHVVNLGQASTWHHRSDPAWHKLVQMREFLQGWPHDELVAVVDGSVFWGGCSRGEFLKAYDEIVADSGAPIIFGSEMTCYGQDCRKAPAIPAYAASDAHGQYANCTGSWTDDCAATKSCMQCSNPPQLKFLNSGFVMGPAGPLSRMMDWAHEAYDHDMRDPSGFAQYWLDNPSLVTLDYQAKLMLSLSDMKQDVAQLQPSNGTVWNAASLRTQCFVNPNGRGRYAGEQLLSSLAELGGSDAAL